MAGVNETFYNVISDLMSDGVFEAAPRGQKIKEILNYTLTLEDPRNRIIQFESRNTSYEYLLAELIWYMSGSNECEPIAKYAPFWSQIKNKDNKTVNSAYGHRIFGHFKHFPLDQWKKTKETLAADPDSRQAVIHINDVNDLVEDIKDFPCTMYLQFFIRKDEDGIQRLHSIANMRSNDIILGFTNDVFQFTMMQEILMEELKREYEQFADLELGTYMHNAGSMHIYERHFQMAQNILAEGKECLESIEKNLTIVEGNEESLPTIIENAWKDFPMIAIDGQWNEGILADIMEFETEYRNKTKGESKSTGYTGVKNQSEAFKRLPEYWQVLFDACFGGYYMYEKGDTILNMPPIDFYRNDGAVKEVVNG